MQGLYQLSFSLLCLPIANRSLPLQQYMELGFRKKWYLIMKSISVMTQQKVNLKCKIRTLCLCHLENKLFKKIGKYMLDIYNDAERGTLSSSRWPYGF